MTNETFSDLIKLARVGAAALGHSQPVATMVGAWNAISAAEQDLERSLKETIKPQPEGNQE